MFPMTHLNRLADCVCAGKCPTQPNSERATIISTAKHKTGKACEPTLDPNKEERTAYTATHTHTRTGKAVKSTWPGKTKVIKE